MRVRVREDDASAQDIVENVDRTNLSVFIWSTARDLKALVQSQPHGQRIWRGVISTAKRPLIEVFPSDQAETGEYRRIVATFFA